MYPVKNSIGSIGFFGGSASDTLLNLLPFAAGIASYILARRRGITGGYSALVGTGAFFAAGTVTLMASIPKA